MMTLFTCGTEPTFNEPFILTDRSALAFQTDFASGTYIGTSAQDHISVTNRGEKDLVISDVTRSGDDAFKFKLQDQKDTDPPSSVLPITVKPKQSTFIEFNFTPTQVQRYHGQVNIKSNATNAADLPIALSGCGLRKLDGGAIDQPDGGCTGS